MNKEQQVGSAKVHTSPPIWAKRIVSGLFSLVIVALVLTVAAGLAAKSKLSGDSQVPGRMVDVDRHKMHLYCLGEGSPTVILEAGLNDFYVSWEKIQPEISETTRICSYDRSGLGLSEKSPNPRTSEAMAEELHTLLGNAGVTPPYILVGHSFGGIVIRTFEAHYPGEVVGMVLVDSAHEGQGARLPFLIDAAENAISQFRTLSMVNKLGLMSLSPESIPNRGFSEEAYRRYQVILATTDYFDGAIAETSAFYLGESLPYSTGLRDLPLIVLSHGIADTSSGIPPLHQDHFEKEWNKMQTELTELSSNSRQIIAHKSGHYIQLEQPDLVIAAILELMQAGR